VKTQARVDENRTLIGVDEEARSAEVPARKPGRHWRAIKNANGH
jgi:hypothetical protein